MFHQALDVFCWVYMGVVGVGFLLYGLLRLSEPFELRWKAHRAAQIDYARHTAVQDIRDIRRRAIHELLAAERQYRNIGSNGEDVIEGTCSEVEVKL